MPHTDWCPGQVPVGLPLNLSLVGLDGNFFGIFYKQVYDPLAKPKSTEINLIPTKGSSEATFQQMKH